RFLLKRKLTDSGKDLIITGTSNNGSAPIQNIPLQPMASNKRIAKSAPNTVPKEYPENISEKLNERRCFGEYSTDKAAAVGITPPKPIPPIKRNKPNISGVVATAQRIIVMEKRITQ